MCLISLGIYDLYWGSVSFSLSTYDYYSGIEPKLNIAAIFFSIVINETLDFNQYSILFIDLVGLKIKELTIFRGLIKLLSV